MEEGRTKQEVARRLVESTAQNVFLTGRAGTGKTTFLRDIRQRAVKRMVVLAPTGVAAINCGGTTLHSFFQLPFGLFLPGYERKQKFRLNQEKINLIRNLDLLVIDEVSMLRADTLDEVDRILRFRRSDNRPFGGVQLLLIGDMQQLAPIVKDDEWEEMKSYYPSPFFFHSRALQQAGFVTVELTHIYRQADPAFIDLLEKIRNSQLDAPTLQLLSSRYRPGFIPPEEEGYITVTTHNYQSDRINEENLAAIKEEISVYEAEIKGNFPESSYPTKERIELKPWAQVMFVKNDSGSERRYYNGKLGKVIKCEPDKVTVLSEGKEIEVVKDRWENTRYKIDQESKQIKEEVEGSFLQLPLKLAWSITIHKSQGLTFDKVVIDAGQAFAHGQVYVALSRCRTLEGVVLRSPLTRESLIPDALIENFCRDTRYRVSPEDLAVLQADYEHRMTGELFDFYPLNMVLHDAARFADEHFSQLYARLQTDLREATDVFYMEVFMVAARFKTQLAALRNAEKSYRDERCYKAAVYFSEKLESWLCPLVSRFGVEIDNRQYAEQWAGIKQKLTRELDEKRDGLQSVLEHRGFDLAAFLTSRSLLWRADVPSASPKSGRAACTPYGARVSRPANPPKAPAISELSEEALADIANTRLAQALIAWRRKKYREEEKLPFQILHQKTLYAIAAAKPRTPEELLRVYGIGKAKVEAYGEEILAVVSEFGF